MNIIQVGQKWRTRDGAIASIKAVDAAAPHSVRGSVGGAGHLSWTPDGRFSRHDRDTCYDLIERMPIIYIAGPMSGYPDLNFPAFHAAAAAYRARGAFVINPAEINGGADELVECAAMTAEQYQAHWAKCMRADIAALMACDEIALLPGWEKSKGASLEHHVAHALGMTVSYP